MLDQEIKVGKFGGSSMADERSISYVRKIVSADPSLRVVAISGPGVSRFFPERYPGPKLTDTLLDPRLSINDKVDALASRFLSIGQQLGLEAFASGLLYQVLADLNTLRGKNPDFLPSRGEWMSANLFAQFSGAEFIEAADLISFKPDGTLDERSYQLIRERVNGMPGRMVIPGYYGLDSSGKIKTFPRGGSDITGAIVARALGASVYENWSDIDGLAAAPPKIVDTPKIIPEITYDEMRELSVRGTTVLQADAILPVYEAGIPTHLRNTFNPSCRGTIITLSRESGQAEGVVGIAGRKSFMAFQVHQFGMHDRIGPGAAILGVFKDQNVSYEHDISGKDYTSVIVNGSDIDGNRADILAGLTRALPGSVVRVENRLAQISLVGQRIGNDSTVIGLRALGVLAGLGVNYRSLEFGTQGNNLVVGIEDAAFEKIVRAFYKEFITASPNPQTESLGMN